MSLFHLLRNVLSNYLRFGFRVLIGFILTPLLLHSFKPGDYGLLILALSIVAVFESISSGFTSALMRFSADLTATTSTDAVRQLFSTVFLLLCTAGFASAGLSFLLRSSLADFFFVGGESARYATTVIGLAGLSLAFTLPSAALSGFLFGNQSFHIVNGIEIGAEFLRASSIILMLWHQAGLVPIAAVFPIIALIRFASLLVAAHLTEIPVLPNIREVNIGSLALIWKFVSLSVIEDATIIWFYQCGSFLAARFISLPAVGILSVAQKFPWALIQITHDSVAVATPVIAIRKALGDESALRKFILVSTRNVLAMNLAIGTPLFIWGEVILGSWAGPKALAGVSALQVFVLFAVFDALQKGPLTLFYGIGRLETSTIISVLMLGMLLTIGAWSCVHGGLLGLAISYAVIQACGTLLLILSALKTVGITFEYWLKKAVFVPVIAFLAEVAWIGISHELLAKNLASLLFSASSGLLIFTAMFVWLAEPPGQSWQDRTRALFYGTVIDE